MSGHVACPLHADATQALIGLSSRLNPESSQWPTERTECTDHATDSQPPHSFRAVRGFRGPSIHVFRCAPGKPETTRVKVPPVELDGSRPKAMPGMRP